MGLKKAVLVFGGGMGGLSTAHELTESPRAQHFDVEVIECDTTHGGKARSQTVCGDPPNLNGYPGEHGFRFFPTFYRHVVDTMRRIPSAFSGRATIFDHLVPTPLRMLARYGKTPIEMPTSPNLLDVPRIVGFLSHLMGAHTGLTPEDLLHFALKLVQVATSSKPRRLAQYEVLSWWEFVDAASRSQQYQHYLANGLTRTLVAAKPNEINAKTGGDVLVRMLVDSTLTGVPASSDRVLDGPTSQVWIDPWIAELNLRKVTFSNGTLLSLDLAPNGCSISGAHVRLPDGSIATRVADYYVAALPVEKMAVVLDNSTAVRDAGARLAGVDMLRHEVRSMTGLQFYLDKPLNIAPKMGHALYVDTEWALTSIAQSNFWRPPFDDLKRWGSGNIRTVWSTIVSDWESAYPSGGRGTNACHSTRSELRDSTIAQLAASLNGDGVQRFDPATLIAWNLDAALTPGPEVGAGAPARNTMQLLVNHPDRWRHRPDPAPTGLNNLLLASDYVRTNTDLATMEAANEAARVAVNAILHREGVPHPCAVYELYYPEVLTGDPFWQMWVKKDEARFNAGLEWHLAWPP
jgi:uncharacterized protein with NAD-binding domain and iron-sulfur cluster